MLVSWHQEWFVGLGTMAKGMISGQRLVLGQVQGRIEVSGIYAQPQMIIRISASSLNRSPKGQRSRQHNGRQQWKDAESSAGKATSERAGFSVRHEAQALSLLLEPPCLGWSARHR